MFVTDVGDEICWRQHWDVGDGFGRFCHQHSLSFNNIEILSPTSKNCHQDKVTNIDLSPTSMWPQTSHEPFWPRSYDKKLLWKQNLEIRIPLKTSLLTWKHRFQLGNIAINLETKLFTLRDCWFRNGISVPKIRQLPS